MHKSKDDLQSSNYRLEYIKILGDNENPDTDEILIHFRAELNDPYSQYDLYELNDLYLNYIESKKASKNHSIFLGALGFLIFTVSAERISAGTNSKDYKDSDTKKLIAINNFAISQKLTFDFIKSEYNLSESIRKELKKILLYKIGTTSYILRAEFSSGLSNKTYALKILKYRYAGNATVRLSTKDYKSSYDLPKYMPKVYESSEQYILMEFVDGLTLFEYIKTESFLKSSNRRKIVRSISLKLCTTLKYFADNPICSITHGDLNPHNIIIKNYEQIDTEEINEQFVDLCFIDFGTNYLLNEKIGHTRAIALARVYIADEVLDDFQNHGIMSDIYSVGVIILQLLNPNVDFNLREFDSYLYNVRLENPVLASILDDMLIDKPNLRLFDMQKKYEGDDKRLSGIYDDLKQDLQIEFKILELESFKSKNLAYNFVIGILSFLTNDFSFILDGRLSEAKMTANKDELEYNFRITTKRLGLWSLIAVLSHVSVLLMFLFYAREYYYEGTLNANICGLVICLSFSFLAVKYYLEIFSNLYPKHLGASGSVTNVWIRFCTLYWTPAIFLVYHFDPPAWAFATFYGTLVIVINNYLCYRLAKNAEVEIEKFEKHELSRNIKRDLLDFKGWWQQMLMYSLVMLGFGILLKLKILKDEMAYAVIIVLVNLKLYFYNSKKMAPKTSNVLQFYFSRYLRVRKFEELNPIPKP